MLAEVFFSAGEFKVWRDDMVEPSEAHFPPATAAVVTPVWGWEGLEEEPGSPPPTMSRPAKLCSMGYSQTLYDK